MFDVIHYANAKNISGVSVNLWKVFDTLRWPFIFAML